MNTSHRTKIAFAAAVFFIVAVSSGVAFASHSWGNYHWARTINPFTLKLGDNVSSAWDAHLSVASADWSVSSVLDTSIVSGQSNPRSCRATSGRAEVCNGKYGNNGWLGIASIWVSGDHITQGTVKLNDTYFRTTRYNKPEWKQLVMCQEIGHIFGLDHQDEIFDNPNLGTCMDYTSDPAANQHPNAHDYEMLETIYAHLDGFSTLSDALSPSKASDIDTSDRSEWGRSIRRSRDGRSSLYERDLGRGQKIFTFVIWADDEDGQERRTARD